jgi:hypothetical protein
MCRAKVMSTYEKQWDDQSGDVTSIQFVDAHSGLTTTPATPTCTSTGAGMGRVTGWLLASRTYMCHTFKHFDVTLLTRDNAHKCERTWHYVHHQHAVQGYGGVAVHQLRGVAEEPEGVGTFLCDLCADLAMFQVRTAPRAPVPTGPHRPEDPQARQEAGGVHHQ